MFSPTPTSPTTQTPPTGSLLVTNNYGLIGGRDEEDDESYRYRLSLWLQSSGGAAEADLRFALLTLPGIQDIDFVRQAGTFLCYVYGISPVVPPSLISLVQSQLDTLTAYPMVGTAVSPALIGISFATTLTFLSTASASDQVSPSWLRPKPSRTRAGAARCRQTSIPAKEPAELVSLPDVRQSLIVLEKLDLPWLVQTTHILC